MVFIIHFVKSTDLLSGLDSHTLSSLSVAYRNESCETVQDMYHKKQELKVNGVKFWEPELRPREKMLEMGAPLMADAELLAMLIGSGTPNEKAVDLAGRILEKVGGNLLKLQELDLKSLCAFDGMGVAKPCSIMAAMELGKRMYPILNVGPVKKVRVSSGAFFSAV